ncbi:unnamed protein product [Rhizophagus irregularis]|nr:unnamed protein product [Rhizophagus irregularis]
MKHSFFYDAYLMDRNIIQQINNTDYEDHKESFHEDDYEAPQTLLQLMIRNIQNEVITEIWEVKPELSQTKFHFVILMADGSHYCTYLKLSIANQELALLEVLSIVKDNYTEITAHREINFDYIHQVRGGYVYTEKLKNIVSVKAKYGRSLGIARKALDLAQKLNCYNELNGLLQMFIDEKQQELLQKDQTIDKENSNDHQRNDESDIICSNPVTSRRRGRPPN